MIRGCINKIIDSSYVDGPGNRTAIFFQGCNFNCKYCHNPETINRCINCGECVNACQSKALSIENNKVIWNKDKCINCDNCVRICKYNSTPKTENLSVDELLERIKKNIPFIRGITVSGGECTLQKEFLLELFKETKKLGLTNFIDTNGSIRFSDFKELLDYTDGVMLDIKSIDNEEHIKLTSTSNEIVLENARFLASLGKLYEIRTVVIEGYLDNKRTVSKTAKIIDEYKKFGDIKYKIIKWRPYGVREEYKNMSAPSEAEMKSIHDILMSYYLL